MLDVIILTAGAKPPSKCFGTLCGPLWLWREAWNKKYVHLLILIWNGCWLLAFCVSWKQLDKADVWAHYFSSQGLTPRDSRREWICYGGHKHLCWWNEICFCGRRCCCTIAFVSLVQMSHEISWVWGFIWRCFGAVCFVPPQRRLLC